MTVPEGAQLSEDGKYWWDGSDWQSVSEDGGGDTEVGQLSDDGQWKWDGSQWVAVDDAGGEGGGAAGDGAGGDGGALQEAMSAQGFQLAPEVADADYIKQVHDHVANWYGGLDAQSQAIVDALAQQGGDTLLADPEVGVVAEGDPLIEAFAGTDKTLGQSLEATGQALEQAAQN
jgi:hypothetical protein